MLAKLLIITGILITLAGFALYFGGRANYFGLGRLPGDIRIEREGFHFYFPITTSIVLSIVLSAILFVISRLR
ncbi:MAG: hypothetical protein AMXMBFR4_29710 [Candidatus Hydrogenedentota bacterium]